MNAAGSASKPSTPANGDNGRITPAPTHAKVETIRGAHTQPGLRPQNTLSRRSV